MSTLTLLIEPLINYSNHTQALKSTPPIMSGVVSGIHPEGFLTMA